MFSQHFSGGPPSTLSRYHIVHISKTANPNISKNIFLNSPNGLESPPIGFQHAHFQKKFQCSEDGVPWARCWEPSVNETGNCVDDCVIVFRREGLVTQIMQECDFSDHSLYPGAPMTSADTTLALGTKYRQRTNYKTGPFKP